MPSTPKCLVSQFHASKSARIAITNIVTSELRSQPSDQLSEIRNDGQSLIDQVPVILFFILIFFIIIDVIIFELKKVQKI